MLDIEFEGNADFFTLYWSNQNHPGSEEKRWTINHIGDPSSSVIVFPDYGQLTESFKIAEMELFYGTLTEADVLDGYAEVASDLLGSYNYYNQAKDLKKLEFLFPTDGGRSNSHKRSSTEPIRPFEILDRGRANARFE